MGLGHGHRLSGDVKEEGGALDRVSVKSLSGIEVQKDSLQIKEASTLQPSESEEEQSAKEEGPRKAR